MSRWPGRWVDQSDPSDPHEASLLNFVIDKAHHQLGWTPRWNFATTLERTVSWYRRVHGEQATALECCQELFVRHQEDLVLRHDEPSRDSAAGDP